MAASGRDQRKKSHALRRPNLRRLYDPISGVRPGAFEFRLTRLTGTAQVDLDPRTVDLTWEDSGAVLTGSVTMRRSVATRGETIGLGERVRCSVYWGGSWYTLWTMRVQIPSGDQGNAETAFDLKDDMALLTLDKRDWSYRKTKKRGRGWTADEITRDVAAQLGLRVRSVAKGRKKINRLVKKNATALDVIQAAYQEEKDKTGRRFVLRLRDGELEVVALQRNEILYEFREQVIGAQPSMTRADNPATVIEARGHTGKGASKKKVKATVEDRATVKRWGRQVKQKDYGKVDSRADLLKQAKRDLAKELKVTYVATITVPGIPFIRRGDGVRWLTDEPGWQGKNEQSLDRSFAYATAVRHQVTGGAVYTTELDLTQEDPYYADAKRLDKLRREKARAARKRRRHQRGA